MAFVVVTRSIVFYVVRMVGMSMGFNLIAGFVMFMVLLGLFYFFVFFLVIKTIPLCESRLLLCGLVLTAVVYLLR